MVRNEDDFYFIVKCTDGTEMDFETMCNRVNYSNPIYIVFKVEDSANRYDTLAIIPHSKIERIIRKEN